MHRHISPWALKRGKVIFKSLSFPLALSRISKVLTTTMPLTPKLIKPHGAGVDRAGGGGGERWWTGTCLEQARKMGHISGKRGSS